MLQKKQGLARIPSTNQCSLNIPVCAERTQAGFARSKCVRAGRNLGTPGHPGHDFIKWKIKAQRKERLFKIICEKVSGLEVSAS